MPSTHTSIHVHVVFSTKNRTPAIDVAWRQRLHSYFGGAIKGTGALPVAIGGTADHIHLLIGLKSTHCLSDLLREIKASSSKWVGDELKVHDFAWQIGYGATSVSATMLTTVSRYIANQEAHHRRRSFEEEYLIFLRKMGVEYDERYLWD
jgi:REP element-mobilizing transposase RayT